MKKLSTFIFFFNFITFVIHGQIPTLTYAKSVTPSIPNTTFSANYYSLGNVVVNPGAAGANKTWDFTTLSGFNYVFEDYTWVNSPTTGSYNTATHSYYYDGGFTFTAHDQRNSLGIYDLGFQGNYFGTPFKITNFNLLMKFPFTYQDSVKNKQYISIAEFGADVFIDTGRVSIIADGYGTLKTFNGTFNNVLRVKTLTNYISRGVFVSTTYQKVNYTWYDVENRRIFSTTKETKDGTTVTYTSTHYDITPLAPPAAPLITVVGKTKLCPNESVTLKAPDGFNEYLWSNGKTTKSIDVTTAGTYTVVVKNVAGSSPSSNPIVITSSPAPSITITGNTDVCKGNSTTFVASGGDKYLWSNGNNTPSITLDNITSPNLYTVTATSTNNCKATKDIQLNVLAVPQVSVTSSANADACEKTKIILLAAGATTYTWTGTGLSQAIGSQVNATISAGQNTFNVTGKDANGCTNKNTITITGTPLPSINAVATNTNPCLGDNISLIAIGAATYDWSSNADGGLADKTGANVKAKPTKEGKITYAVIGTDTKGCKSIPFTIEVNVKNCGVATNDKDIENDIIVFPNPFLEKIFFTNTGKIESVSIFDALGKLLFIEKDILQGIDFQNFSNQTYFLKIKMSDGNTLIKKIIKQ